MLAVTDASKQMVNNMVEDANTSPTKKTFTNMLLTVKRMDGAKVEEEEEEEEEDASGRKRWNGFPKSLIKDLTRNSEKPFLKSLFTLLKSSNKEMSHSKLLLLSRTMKLISNKKKSFTKAMYVMVVASNQSKVYATSALFARTSISVKNVKQLFHILILSLN